MAKPYSCTIKFMSITSLKRRQGGFAVLAAVFILVVLASMAAYVVSISSAQQMSAALDMLGGRALQVARSGMDWGVSRVIAAPPVLGTENCLSAGAAGPINLTSGPGGDFKGHAGFTVTIRCKATLFQDGGQMVSYEISATACNEPRGGACPNTGGAGADYVERQLTTHVVCSVLGPC